MTRALVSSVTGLHHVSLRVANLDKSLALYRDTLGLPVTLGFVLEGRRFALVDAGNRGCIELVETPSAIHAARPDDVIWHFALGTTDLDGALAAVSAAGYTITMPARMLDLVDTVHERPFAIRIAFFKGPDGEDVELVEEQP